MRGFETRVFGKWILSGEHAVLRGSPALVFPLYSRYLEFSYMPDAEKYRDLNLQLLGGHGSEMEMLFWKVIDQACCLVKIGREELTGELRVASNIPVGAGLGASAALCVAVARWFRSLDLIKDEEMYEFARNLENLFHGESSGVDIAVALSGQGLRFVRNQERRLVQPSWQPKWYVSYSGQRGITSDCVSKVKEILKAEPRKGETIDEDMRVSVQLAEEALQSPEKVGFKQLAEAINLANSCFRRWNLSPDQHISELTNRGAVAAKPTGSGGGGFVLSLWGEPPPADLASSLIPCFQ